MYSSQSEARHSGDTPGKQVLGTSWNDCEEDENRKVVEGMPASRYPISAVRRVTGIIFNGGILSVGSTKYKC